MFGPQVNSLIGSVSRTISGSSVYSADPSEKAHLRLVYEQVRRLVVYVLEEVIFNMPNRNLVYQETFEDYCPHFDVVIGGLDGGQESHYYYRLMDAQLVPLYITRRAIDCEFRFRSWQDFERFSKTGDRQPIDLSCVQICPKKAPFLGHNYDTEKKTFDDYQYV